MFYFYTFYFRSFENLKKKVSAAESQFYLNYEGNTDHLFHGLDLNENENQLIMTKGNNSFFEKMTCNEK